MYSHIYVEVTNICNMSCSFCHGHSRDPRRMSADEFSRILEMLKEHTKYIYYHLMGEPLTHPLLPDFIKMANERGFMSVITTNGSLLKKRGSELLNAGVYKVNISVHSFEEQADERYLEYLNDIAEFAEAAASAGTIVVLRLWNNGVDQEKNDYTIDFLRKRICGEWAENTRGLRIKNKLHLEFGDRFVWPDINSAECSEQVFCYGLDDHFGILCDGTVVPCCMDSDGIINLGNVWSSELSDILMSPRAEAIRQGFKRRSATESLCSKCGYAQRFQ